MPDYDLLMMAKDNFLAATGKEPGRWLKGQVVDVFEAGKLDPTTQHHRFKVVRVKGYVGRLQDIKDEFLEPDYVTDAEGGETFHRRRKFIDERKQDVGVKREMSEKSASSVNYADLVVSDHKANRRVPG